MFIKELKNTAEYTGISKNSKTDFKETENPIHQLIKITTG